MRLPIETMGKEAARLLRKALHGDNANQQISLQCHVIARASSTPSTSLDRP
jgi:DNA-binding LacI/PurR family transcriptional regulator